MRVTRLTDLLLRLLLSRTQRQGHAITGAICVCVGWTLTGGAVSVAAQDNAEFALDSTLAGDRPAQRISFDLEGGEPETYGIRVSYPEAFSLIGFDDLGPPGSPVGAFEIEFAVVAPPGADPPSLMVPLISLGSDSAYADVIADGRFSHDLEPRLVVEGANDLVMRLPFGGDANPTTVLAPLPGHITVTLLRGPLQNPDVPGSYGVQTEVTSVDPDTDGRDDGVDPSPQVVQLQVPVKVQPSLAIHRASLATFGQSIGGFGVSGRIAEGGLGDLTELALATLEVHFGSFVQTIAGSDFRPIGAGWIYVPGNAPGIDRVLLRDDGRFQIAARGLDLPPFLAPDQETIRLPFSLRIDRHRVANELAFDAKGRLQP